MIECLTRCEEVCVKQGHHKQGVDDDERDRRPDRTSPLQGKEQGHHRRQAANASSWTAPTSTQAIEGQMEQEARAMTRVTRTEDGWNGICEVAARRKPVFVGR